MHPHYTTSGVADLKYEMGCEYRVVLTSHFMSGLRNTQRLYSHPSLAIGMANIY